MITFEIEPEPTDEGVAPGFWGVWEHDSEDPDTDEIVAMFPSEQEAQEWINTTSANLPSYLASRGISQ